jgi:hypothetical protein
METARANSQRGVMAISSGWRTRQTMEDKNKNVDEANDRADRCFILIQYPPNFF